MKHSLVLVVLVWLTTPVLAQRKPGSPLDHLPPNIEMLTAFGERADISPDNQRIAFMNKSFGDAFVIDLKTRVIRCLTRHIPGAAFLRVMHLKTGDYMLIGPDHFEDIRISRARDNELWFLSQEPKSTPIRLNKKMSEGMAIPKTSMLVLYSQKPDQIPELPAGSSRLLVAELSLADGKPSLINEHVVHQSPDASCTIEAQDFYANDTKMTFTCYEPQSRGSVMGIDLTTGQVTNFSKAPGTYQETEGIFPDGLYTTVEGDVHVEQLGGQRGFSNLDIYKLRLAGTGKDFTRLTFFNEYEQGKTANPVVSTDGRFMAFQVGNPKDTTAGIGYGIGLLWFNK